MCKVKNYFLCSSLILLTIVNLVCVISILLYSSTNNLLGTKVNEYYEKGISQIMTCKNIYIGYVYIYNESYMKLMKWLYLIGLILILLQFGLFIIQFKKLVNENYLVLTTKMHFIKFCNHIINSFLLLTNLVCFIYLVSCKIKFNNCVSQNIINYVNILNITINIQGILLISSFLQYIGFFLISYRDLDSQSILKNIELAILNKTKSNKILQKEQKKYNDQVKKQQQQLKQTYRNSALFYHNSFKKKISHQINKKSMIINNHNQLKAIQIKQNKQHNKLFNQLREYQFSKDSDSKNDSFNVDDLIDPKTKRNNYRTVNRYKMQMAIEKYRSVKQCTESNI